MIYESDRTNPPGGIYHQYNKGLEFGKHLHNSFELIYVYSGKFTCEIDDALYTAHKGEAILIFPNQIHFATRNEADEKPETYLCVFENELVREFYYEHKGLAPENPVFKISNEKVIERIAGCNDSRYFLKSCLYEMVHIFEMNQNLYRLIRARSAEKIGRIFLYIAEHYSENISMKDVADTIGYDHHYLSCLLNKELNTTFRVLLNEYRISAAKNLIRSTDDSFIKIASACGYDSICSFNRNFRQHTGVSPTEYRQMQRER